MTKEPGTKLADDFGGIRAKMQSLGLEAVSLTPTQVSDETLLVMMHVIMVSKKSLGLWEMASFSGTPVRKLLADRLKVIAGSSAVHRANALLKQLEEAEKKAKEAKA